jgi:hypothetical protein
MVCLSVSSVVNRCQSLFSLPDGQASLHGELDGFIDRDPDDTGGLVDPPVAVQDGVLARPEGPEVLPRVGLEPRFRWQAGLLTRRERVLRHDAGSLATTEIDEQQPHHDLNQDRGDEQARSEAEDAADVDIALLVTGQWFVVCHT